MSKKVVKLKERREKKISDIRNKRRKRMFIVLGLIILAIILSWTIYQSNFFQVAEIKVKGNKHIADEQVIINSGIRRSDNLLTLPTAKISKKLKKLSWVQSAAILRSWPDTVVLDIIERKPLAVIETDTDSFLIDDRAFVIEKNATAELDKLPKIEELTIKNIKKGTYIKNDSLDNALLALQSLDKGLRSQVFSITARSVDELYFVASGIEIVYGKAEKNELKNQVIKTMLKHKKENISTIDVRVPEKPVLRVLGK